MKNLSTCSTAQSQQSTWKTKWIFNNTMLSNERARVELQPIKWENLKII